jgi:hemerythrin-like domain-containing protein
MRAIELLMEEHLLIERGLRALLLLAERGKPGPEIASVLSFLSEFADGHHHAKEEKILFPAMEEAGFPHDDGPLAVMLHEHDLGRALIARMRELSPLESDAARTGFRDAARQYAELLSQHIQKENTVLFQMAERAIQRPEQLRVDEEFDSYESGAQEVRSRQQRELERVAAALGT